MTTLSAVFAIIRFQLVWLLFVIGAANGLWWPGVAGAAVLMAIQLAYAKNRGSEIMFLAMAILIAIAAEVAFYSTGAIRYSTHWPYGLFAPAWIFGLWLAFATAVPATNHLLAKHAATKSILLGAIFGPIAYYGAAQYGAITIHEPFWMSLTVIGITWAAVFPAMIKTYQALVDTGSQSTVPQA